MNKVFDFEAWDSYPCIGLQIFQSLDHVLHTVDDRKYNGFVLVKL